MGTPVLRPPLCRACVCVRASVCPSACRETVPVTRSKQARGRQGPGYATFGVMTASLLFTLDNSLF